MRVIFYKPELTMKKTDDANLFFAECKSILDLYATNVVYISSDFQLNTVVLGGIEKNDILIFFTNEEGYYSKEIIKSIKKYNDAQSRIWAVAMYSNPECRRPPEPVSEKQSFDVSCRNENRNPLKNNMKAIAQIFSRKIIAQILSPLYRDEVLYFITHRRADGERIAAKLADELVLLTRERNVYRDVVNVEVGDDAQKDINEKLAISDVLIFVQTEQVKGSKYIEKELCYALVNDIPVLWIQIDNASYENMGIRPGEAPILCYASEDFEDKDKLIQIAEEIEDCCFQLIMNSSNQVFSYIQCFSEMNDAKKIKFTNDVNATLAFDIEYIEKTRDLYSSGVKKHYIQCFGRNPKDDDLVDFAKRIKPTDKYQKNDRVFLLSNHGRRDKPFIDERILEENYDDYIINLENVSGSQRVKQDKRIVLSGAFPDSDEIYKNSLLEALVVYSKEIIKNGYTLVFGAHPTFQQLIFDIGELYATDIKYSIEMHMSEEYASLYDINELQKNCTLVLSRNLQEMREKMICAKKNEMLICLGGKIKEDKSQQGVDIEVALAKTAGVPVALVGTVGGRSSELAGEFFKQNSWNKLNSWDRALNEALFYNVNHRLMIRKLLEMV